jgi:hypothetical protein
MKHKRASVQPDLFEQEEPCTLPSLLPQDQLATLLAALLIEIAVVLAAREVSDDQDHG